MGTSTATAGHCWSPLDELAAREVRVELAAMRRAARRLASVATRSADGAPLFRVAELLAVLDPKRAEAVRRSCRTPAANSKVNERARRTGTGRNGRPSRRPRRPQQVRLPGR